MYMTGVSLHSCSVHSKGLGGSVWGGFMQDDMVDWIEDVEMHIFTINFSTLLAVQHRENSRYWVPS